MAERRHLQLRSWHSRGETGSADARPGSDAVRRAQRALRYQDLADRPQRIGAATSPSRSSSAARVIRPRFAWQIATREKSRAYLSLKLRLRAMRVAVLAVGSAPVPLNTSTAERRRRSLRCRKTKTPSEPTAR
jgi:hypothetical protein